jgi:hypothetical protein
MSNFEIGDWVYADEWCYGQITDLHSSWAVVEFQTDTGGGSFSFKLDDLVKAPAPENKREFIEYVRIVLHHDTDMLELENHLSMNGYNFGIDRFRHYLFVYIDELAYVETILSDRDIVYEVTEA